MYGVTDMTPDTAKMERQIKKLKAALAYIGDPQGLRRLDEAAVPAEQWHRFVAYEHRVKFAQRTLERLG